jgi:hypothetical protein
MKILGAVQELRDHFSKQGTKAYAVVF